LLIRTKPQGYRKVEPLFVPRILPNMAAGHVSINYGFHGPGGAATTACTTGADSIIDAFHPISIGHADVMIAGSSESCIHPLTFAGFGRARSLSTAYNHAPRESCRPFDSKRNGFVIGEGAGVCVLEELEHAKARGARIYAEITGYGRSMDAHHITAPPEDGRGAYLAMRRALEMASVRPSRVDYINAHGTGTLVGDKAEARAIRRVMLGGEGVSNESQVTVSSTKGAMGHLLGGAGAVEALFAILAVHEVSDSPPPSSISHQSDTQSLTFLQGMVPATLNLESPDVGVDFNFVPLRAQEKKIETSLSNSFGFGGMNSSLIFSKFR
jgi:3-oxoacyl-[acyl-carrier-protein] synthase II